MIAKQKPVIVLNRAVVDVPSVVTDNARGARLAVEHLAGLGHESLAYAAGPEASWADGKRWQSLRDAAGQLDLRIRRLGPVLPRPARRPARRRGARRPAGDGGRGLQRPGGDRARPRPDRPRPTRARGHQRHRVRQHRRGRTRHARADHGGRSAPRRGPVRRRAPARDDRRRRAAAWAGPWCCRSGSWSAGRRLSAAGTAPRRPPGRRTSRRPSGTPRGRRPRGPGSRGSRGGRRPRGCRSPG